MNTIRDLTYPSTVFLIFIQLKPSQRQKRLETKGIANENDLMRIEGHPTEKQVQTVLPRVADFLVDGSKPAVQTVRDILARIEKKLS